MTNSTVAVATVSVDRQGFRPVGVWDRSFPFGLARRGRVPAQPELGPGATPRWPRMRAGCDTEEGRGRGPGVVSVHLGVSARPGRGRRSAVEVDDLELEEVRRFGDGLLAHGLVCGLAVGPPVLEILAGRPLGVDEVLVAAGDGAQQLEALEPGSVIDGVLALGEALLELGASGLGDGEGVDGDD